MAGLESPPLGHAPFITLYINSRIIAEGTRRNSNHCMVAEALKEGYPHLKYVSVDIQTIRATDKKKGERYVWLTPRRIQQMIIDFDAGVKPRPFRVECRYGQTTAKGSTRPSIARLRRPGGLSSSKSHVPVKTGGRTPPKGVGQRRAFGLRSLQF